MPILLFSAQETLFHSKTSAHILMFNLLADGLYKRHKKAQKARNEARDDRSRRSVKDWLSSLDSDSETTARKKRAKREAQGWIYFDSPDPSTDGEGSVTGGGFVESSTSSESGNTQSRAKARKQKHQKRKTKPSSVAKPPRAALEISKTADGHLWYMHSLGRAKVAWHLTPDGRYLDGWRYYYHDWNASTVYERQFVQGHVGKPINADRKVEQNKKKRRSFLKRQNRARQAPLDTHTQQEITPDIHTPPADIRTHKEKDTASQRKARRKPTGWVRSSRRVR